MIKQKIEYQKKSMIHRIFSKTVLKHIETVPKNAIFFPNKNSNRSSEIACRTRPTKGGHLTAFNIICDKIKRTYTFRSR